MLPLIEFQHATLGYGRKIVLQDVNFAINSGDYFGMVGPNGAGKTTLLRAILGTLKPLSGKVVVQAAATTTLRFGYVPQRDTIDDILPYTVQEVVMMGRYRQIGIFRRPQKSDRDFVLESLQHVDIADLRHRVFKDLSGGQKQRVLIARALAAKPAALILDEPTNGMDFSSKISILDLIHQLHEEDRLTVIMVSHFLDDVANYVKRLAVVERNFFQVGEVDEVLNEKNLSSLYQMPILVTQVNGSKVILAGEHRGN